MVISTNSASLGFNTYLIEPKINRDASDYITNNYSKLLEIIKRYKIKDEKASDLLHDVCISIIEAENDGNGFDMEFGNNEGCSNKCNLMHVEQFVIGRIKLYAKNSKYRTDIIEKGKGYVQQTVAHYEPEIDMNGRAVENTRGNAQGKKVTEHKKVPVQISVNAASFNDGADAAERNDDFQKAYATAAIADTIDDITEMYSLREQINYCIDFCDLHGVQIMNLFRNMDMLACMLGGQSKRKVSEGVFRSLSKLTEYHSDFSEALMNVLSYSARNRAAFDVIINSI